ncbi:MAG: M1 family aminopeptidase [Saprospiraceae bacterium]|nr:M1 family aminopeptidase [Saprospiraceae bacterium]MDZ4706135.1 M1 family aminopeptidase [Saprospiraceae bacterium]
MKHLLLLLAVIGMMAGCKTPQTTVSTSIETMEERNLDTLEVSGAFYDPEELEATAPESDVPLPAYKPSQTRENDLLHVKLDLRFNWEKEQVIGKATLKLKPYFYPSSSVTLDAKGFDIQKVTFEGSAQPLKYDYENDQLVIQLGRFYTRNEQYSIYIEYIAQPAETGGSAAITSNQGLFFINPRGEETDKPRQIWTQGETEWNSRWFPVIDKPNERCTQEIYLTVEDQFKTLSNGLLVSSKKNTDGTRTDYWKMDQPHAPYLFMIAVGDYAVVKDTWSGVPIEYYVEPKFKDHAKRIFAYTPELLDFFSKKTGLKYPWPKFSQIVVRDYVSGAMENTTAVIYGEFMQQTSRELIDNLTNEKIVAHEMFHHWFGDYVTTESWANLTLNEGFANYSEYLWLEHKYGADEADYHLLEEWNGYLGSAQSDVHPLIHYRYADKEDMFDAHSYNKGGSVLHMLRSYIGEEAFWLALGNYLKAHAYEPVEVHNLRLAFEDVTGQDLNWFFDQWYFDKGHPVLNISFDYDDNTKTAIVNVEQIQDPAKMRAAFELPVAIDIYLGSGKPERHNVRVNERAQMFTFEVPERPKLMVFDAEHTLLGVLEDNKTEDELAFQYLNAPKLYDRYEAVQLLAYTETETAKKVFKAALKDKFWGIRLSAIELAESEAEADLALLRQMAESDPHSAVRASAFLKLSELEDTGAVTFAKRAIGKDSSYTVISSALELLNTQDKAAALEAAQGLEKETNSDILGAVATMYAESEDLKYLPFFERNMEIVDGFGAISFFSGYGKLATSGSAATGEQVIAKLKAIAINMKQSPWRRVAATRTLFEMKMDYAEKIMEARDGEKTALENLVSGIAKMLEDIKSVETEPQIKSLYEQFSQ